MGHKINESRMSVIRIIIAGEFGVVFKAQLVNWQGNWLPQVVAVKTVKGTFN